MEEAVVFEAAPAEKRVEGVQALLTLHRASVGTVDVRRAFRRQRPGQLLLRQLLVPDDKHTDVTAGRSQELSSKQSQAAHFSFSSSVEPLSGNMEEMASKILSEGNFLVPSLPVRPGDDTDTRPAADRALTHSLRP